MLKTVGLGWVSYRVVRRTHSSLMKERGVDPKIVADQQRHTVDVNLSQILVTLLAQQPAERFFECGQVATSNSCHSMLPSVQIYDENFREPG